MIVSFHFYGNVLEFSEYVCWNLFTKLSNIFFLLMHFSMEFFSLFYSNVIFYCVESPNELQAMVNRLMEVNEKVGMKVNI